MSDDPKSLRPPPDGDCISIENLQLAKPVKAPNIWNEVKHQPAWLTVHIYLRSYFSSAASADALDESTIHYGNLAKLLRSECATESDGGAVVEVASAAIEQMAKKPKIDRCIAERMVVKLLLPKASAYGSALEIHETTPCTEKGRDHSSITRTLVCRGLKIMTLIGVNDYERKAKQPLIVDFTMNYHDRGGSTLGDMESLFPLERSLVQIIESTEFETLESLAEHTWQHLQAAIKERAPRNHTTSVHLRFAKPCAIAFADAPVIEMRRVLSRDIATKGR